MFRSPSCLPRTLVAALWVATAGATSARAQRDSEDRAPEVRDIRFEGVKSVSKDDLANSIATEESGCRSWLMKPLCLFTKSKAVYERHELDRSEFRRDVIRIKVFYYRRGYRDAQVDTVVTQRGDRVDVRFIIREGPPTVIARTEVVYPPGIVSGRLIKKQLNLRPGDPLNLMRLDTSLVRIRTSLANEGYADADVVAESISVVSETRLATLRIRIDPKYRTMVGDIRISGNDDVSDRTIRNSLYLKSGEAFKREDMIRSQRHLYGTNMFRRASISIFPPDSLNPGPDSIKHIDVSVQEAPLREARARVGFNTVEFLQSDGRYTEYNWFGRGRQLTVQAAVGNLGARQFNGMFPFRDVLPGFQGDVDPFFMPTWHASADIVQPAFFFSPKNAGGVGIFAHRRSAPAIYVDRGYGASMSFTRELAARAPLSASYRLEFTKVEAGDLYFCVNFGVCEIETIGALRLRQRLSPVSVTLNIDRTSDPLGPRHGYFSRLDLEHASGSTFSDFRYNRASAEGAVYRPIGRRGTLAGHLKLGWVGAIASTGDAIGIGTDVSSDLLHPRKRFYAGGARSVRGYGENQLGPRVLTISDETLRGRYVDDVTGEVGYSRCPPPTPITDCDPNDPGLFDRYFFPRPVGGNSLIEGSVELRVPIFWKLMGAVFIDGGIVGEGSVRSLTDATGALTPGFGFRYRSPVGPIRVDFGINPRLRERMTVVTEDRSTGARRIVRLNRERELYPRDDPRGIFGWMRSRLTMHLSIGEAY